MNKNQTHALRILKDATTPKDKQRRGTELITCLEPKEGYGPLPEDFCQGWAFKLGPSFADALDIIFQQRKRNKKSYSVWTQGSRFDFKQGYTIHSTDGKTVVQVAEASPVEPGGGGIKRDPGKIELKFYSAQDGPKIWKLERTETMTQDDLVRLLILGDKKAMYDVNSVPHVFNASRIQSRNYDELVGLCKGIIADNQVNQSEASFLLNWLNNHDDVADIFPADTLINRLADMLVDSNLDKDEATELLALLREFTGEKGQQAQEAMPTEIPFDVPMPEVNFEYESFCLTGTFLSGRRSEIEDMLESFGARITDAIRKSYPRYLVVGSLVTKSWKYASHGTKIEDAMGWRAAGSEISIISEDHLWNEIQRLGLKYNSKENTA